MFSPLHSRSGKICKSISLPAGSGSGTTVGKAPTDLRGWVERPVKTDLTSPPVPVRLPPGAAGRGPRYCRVLWSSESHFLQHQSPGPELRAHPTQGYPQRTEKEGLRLRKDSAIQVQITTPSAEMHQRVPGHLSHLPNSVPSGPTLTYSRHKNSCPISSNDFALPPSVIFAFENRKDQKGTWSQPPGSLPRLPWSHVSWDTVCHHLRRRRRWGAEPACIQPRLPPQGSLGLSLLKNTVFGHLSDTSLRHPFEPRVTAPRSNR